MGGIFYYSLFSLTKLNKTYPYHHKEKEILNQTLRQSTWPANEHLVRCFSVLTNGCAKNGLDEKPEGWVVSSESCGFLSIGECIFYIFLQS